MSEFVIQRSNGFSRISFEEIEGRISLDKKKYSKNVICGFCDEISLDLIVQYLACREAGGLPVFLSHPSVKTIPALFEERLANWKRLGIGSFYSSFVNEPQSALFPIENTKNCSFIQLSSGTTASQKGFGISEATLTNQLEYYKNKLQLTKDSVIVSWLPVYHDMGLVTSVFLPLYVGCKSVIIPTFDWLSDYSLFFEAVNKFGGTHCWFPNFCFELYSRECNISRLENENFHIINCSETCRADSVNKFKKLYKCKISCCYAMAENVFAVSQSDDLEELDGILNCGIPDGANIELDAQNQIWISGNSLFDALLQDGKLIPQNKEKYNTGDVGVISKEKLYIVGRTKEIVKIFGKQIFLPDVDKEINDRISVHQGRVVSFGDLFCGSESLVVLYEANENYDKEIRETTFRLFGVTAKPSRVPDGILVKTSSGKISREKNKERYEKYKLLGEIVKEYGGIRITFFSNLKSEGLLDSLTLMETVSKLFYQNKQKINWGIDFGSLDSVLSILELV